MTPNLKPIQTRNSDVVVGFVAPPRTGITSFNTKGNNMTNNMIFVNQTYLNLIQENREQFSDEFVEWLPQNFHVWHNFARETFKIIDIGFKHYSARTILHFLRHHTAVEQRSTEGFKLNNNYSPYLARLWALRYPDRGYIFEYRNTPKAKSNNRHLEDDE